MAKRKRSHIEIRIPHNLVVNLMEGSTFRKPGVRVECPPKEDNIYPLAVSSLCLLLANIHPRKESIVWKIHS